MKRGRQWLRLLMPLMAITFLGFAQNSFAQDDYQYDNNGNYDNSDEALIQPENDVNYNTFHDELSPYGSWRDYPGYGNVWVCNVSGFRPYDTGGHWAYTRFGWTWVSDYNWGWAPFHYGRWAFDNAFGWFWVPGYTWGPAWVSWRNGGDYYGWAPLSPGLNISVNVGMGIPAASWIFLPHRYMGYRNVNSYYVPRNRNVTIIRNTTIINNTNVYNNNRYATGPERRQVERYTGQRVQQQNIYVSNNRNVDRQDRNGVHLFNPNVNRGVVNNRNNNQLNNRQENVRQQPANDRSVQNGVQQQNNTAGNNRIDRFQQRREDRVQQGQPDNQNGNNQQNDPQRRQRMQDMRDRMQQNNDQRRQQIEQQRQQLDNQRQQQADPQNQQQINDRRQQMQQQMDQRRQQQDDQRQQQMQQQRQQQMQERQQQQDAQRQQMMQQRQQQMQQQRQQQMQQRQQMQQQRSQEVNRPVMQSGGGRRRNG